MCLGGFVLVVLCFYLLFIYGFEIVQFFGCFSEVIIFIFKYVKVRFEGVVDVGEVGYM